MPEQYYGGWDYPSSDPYAGQGWNYDFSGGSYDPYAAGGWGLDPTWGMDPFGPYSGGAPGSSFGEDNFFLDTETGQTLSMSQILADPTLSQAYQQQTSTSLGTGPGKWLPGGNVIDMPEGSISPTPTVPWYKDPSILAMGAIGLPTLLGLGGLIQGLTSDGQGAKTVVQPTQSPTSQAAQQAALQGFQGAQQFAFGGGQQPGDSQLGVLGGQAGVPSGGLAGQLQAMAPLQQQSTLSAIQGLMNQMQTNPFLTGGLQGQLAQQAQGFGGAQAPLLGMAGIGATQLGPSPYTQQFLNQIQGMSAPGVNPASQALTAQAQGLAQNPLQPGLQVQDVLDRMGQVGPLGPNTATQTALGQIQGLQAPQPGTQVGEVLAQLQRLSAPGPSPYTQAFLNQVPGLPNQMTPQGILGSLQGQALGMSQGNLPALNPALREQVRQIFLGPQQDINRYLDQALQGTLGRARQQGFAGGTEVFREGTPAALLAPGLAEAQRQQGSLAGQEAAAVLALAQALPQQGGALASTAGNLAQQNLAAQQSNIGLGLTGAQQLFGQQATGSQLEQAIAALRLQGAQVPWQQLLQAAQNQQALGALGLQGGQALFGQQATGQQLQQALLGLQLQGGQVPFQQALQAGQQQQAAVGLGMQGAQNVFGQQATANQLQQALAALGLQGAQNQFQQGLSANQNLQQAAQGYTTPMSVALGGGLNLSNLNQNIIQQLGAFGQQGMGNQLDFLRAISAPLSGLSGLSEAAQAGVGSTSTQTQPFNLLSAFAPTASLLGGIGGAMTGYGTMTNPAQYRYPARYGGYF